MKIDRTREGMIILVAISLLGGFLSGLVIWNFTREYQPAPVIAEATLVAPYVTIATNTAVPIPPTPEPTVEPQLRARLSYYWPPNLGPNCHPDNIVDGECTSWLTDGTRWHPWSWWHEKYATVACPSDWKLGTRFYIPALQKTYICIDRGGAISILPDNTFFLDILQSEPPWVQDGVDGNSIVRDEYSPSGSYVVDVIIVE